MVIWRELSKMRAGSQTMTTRPSAVAGMFYPGDPDRLRMHVLDLLADVAASKVMPKALIAPHAGYAYSGRVAAAAFATLRDSAQTITRVVLIGPAHYVHMRGIAAPTVDAFESPVASNIFTFSQPAAPLCGPPALAHSVLLASNPNCR
jgi:MEMO1 family protein